MKIIQMSTQPTQNVDSLGRLQVGIQVYGLGDDSKIYMYDFDKKNWLEPEPMIKAQPPKQGNLLK